ncbi:MAG: flippase-like domain-containing protein, partial [Acidobacteria bacterium]|nr:flippase-like domain-containing protein [Acidobacteriota bacterium]
VAWALVTDVRPSGPLADLGQFFTSLPSGPADLIRLLYSLGSLWAAGLVVAAALVARRWRLARDLALAGAVAWLVARTLGFTIEGNSDLTGLVESTTRLGSVSPSFPAVRVAIVTAVVRAAAPYLTRPSRRIGAVLVLVTVLGGMYLGAATPWAAVVAWVVGVGVAAAIHLGFGSPGGRPTLGQMRDALHELGLDVRDLQLDEVQAGTSTTMTATGPDGSRLAVRVLGRDEADAQIIGRTWHRILYRSSPGRLFLSRIEDVEHEAYCVLRAAQAGVRVPEVVVTGTAGPGAAVYVERPVAGVALSELPIEEIDERLLEQVWDQVVRLHSANVAHLDLTAERVVIGDDGPAIVGFADAAASRLGAAADADVASLLVATTRLVGADRAVAAAAFALGRDRLVDVLPLLQTAVLPPTLRGHGRAERKAVAADVAALRTVVAHAADVDPPRLNELHRISGTTLLLVIGTFLGVAALLSQVGDPAELWDTMSQASPWWIVLALVVSLSTNVTTAVALMGSVPIRIPLARTTELQLSLTFANLAIPSVGGLAAQVRYLQKQGVDLAAAVAAGGVVSGVANVTVTSTVCLIALVLSPISLQLDSVAPSSLFGLLVIAAAVVGVVCAVVFGVPAIRRRVVEPARSAWGIVRSVARSPRQLSQLVLGWAGNALLYALVLYACVAAFGPPVDYWTVLLINTGVSTLAFAVPVPGGSTAVSSVGIAGALAAAGASQEVAVAASLAYQVTATFIPAVPGWVAFRDLLDHDYL